MTSSLTKTPAGPAFDRRLLWLVGLRLLIVTILLGGAVVAEWKLPGLVPFGRLLWLIAFTYAMTAAYAVTLRSTGWRRSMIAIGVACDALIVTAIIAATGGVESYFSALYLLPIIAASILLSRRAGMKTAGMSAVVYAGLVVLQYTLRPAWLFGDPAGDGAMLTPERIAQYTVLVNVFWFFIVAVLGGYLAGSLRRAGARLELASSQLADLQAFQQHIIESLTSGLATTGTDGRVLSFNAAAEAITGQTGMVIGRPIADVLQLPPPFQAALDTRLTESKDRRLDLDFAYTRSDGTRIELGLSAAPLITRDGPSGFLFTFQDVTTSRRLEREARRQQRLAAVGEMAAGIAHEIRNPLASMSGSIQILRQELTLSDEQAQLMDIVLRESERLNDIITSFLAYARPQRRTARPIDLRDVVRDTVILLRNSPELGQRHQVELDVPADPVSYEADEGQMRQIVWNLATNGLRAMPTGGCLRLGARHMPEAAGGGVSLSVEDQGVGMDQAELDGMFQPFRGSFSKGAGLGLAIVHRIASDYDGSIRVTSQPGAGTTVEVRLPAPRVVGIPLDATAAAGVAG
jgi:two-component system sensor histidine kinase PilS (NtrC family)